MAVTNIYATAANVQSFLNSLGGPGITLGAASKPTITEAELWLDQVAAEIDSLLIARGYGTVPASGDMDKLLIGRYVAQKVASMVWIAGFMSDELPEKVRSWAEEYDLFVERLIKGTQQLVDQNPISRSGSLQMSKYDV